MKYICKIRSVEAKRLGPNNTDFDEMFVWIKHYVGSFGPDRDIFTREYVGNFSPPRDIPKKGITISPITGLMVIVTPTGLASVTEGNWVLRCEDNTFYVVDHYTFKTFFRPEIIESENNNHEI